MDNSGQHRRQNDPPAYHTNNQRYSLQLSSTQNGNSERHRSGTLSVSASTPRAMGATGNYSTYYQEPTAAFSTSSGMTTAAMTYGSDYGTDGRAQTQGFGGYNAGMMMYNIPQQGSQGTVYDTQQFGQRQQTAMQMMTPDVASAYFSSDGGAGATPGAGTSTNMYSSNQSMAYTGVVHGVSAMHQASGTTDTSIPEQKDQTSGGLEEKWFGYQQQLGAIFQDIAGGSLERAADTLLHVSSWLLSQVTELGIIVDCPLLRIMLICLVGLCQDDASLHGERIKLWNDFNHAWLALGFRQREMMISGHQPSRTQKLMQLSTIKKMGDELIRLCDGIEPHGLVDYQYGVWEERIESGMSVYLVECFSS